MNTPALHNYGQMPRSVAEYATPMAIEVPRAWAPLAPRYARRIAISSKPRGNIRLILGISVAVALASLLFAVAGAYFARLLLDSGVMFGFAGLVFVASVAAGYFVSGLSIQSALAE